MTLVSVRNLCIAFGDRTVLHDVSFEIEDGENIAIIGPNGSGKTLLLKSLLGLVPHTGSVQWRSGTRLGYVPQKIDADRSLPLNARNLLYSKARVIGCDDSDIADAVARVGLSAELLSTHIGNLSGGEFQRTLVGFAILGKPQILLLDEPTASLDEPGEEQMYELIQRLHDEMHIATITVSHDLSFVYRYAHRVLCLNRSGVCYGPPRGVLTSDVLDQLFGTRAFYEHAHNA